MRQPLIQHYAALALCAIAATAPLPLNAEPAPSARPLLLAADTRSKVQVRAVKELVTPPGTLAREAGYVHFFVITGLDGEPETQIGIELADGRIAWSLLDHGVTVSAFVSSGSVDVNGTHYPIRHLYGIRPFGDRRTMEAFQRALPQRIDEWLESAAPYCTEELPAQHGCVSCLGFVARVLYPGRVFGALPALPPDFRSVRKNVYTTEDLLLYLARVPTDGTREARMRRIQALDAPAELHEELVRLASELEPSPPPKRRAASLPKRMLPRRGS